MIMALYSYGPIYTAIMVCAILALYSYGPIQLWPSIVMPGGLGQASRDTELLAKLESALPRKKAWPT